MLGAFAGLTGLVTMDGIKKAMQQRFKAELVEKNMQAVERTFSMLKN